jgi:BASS family bile acid:Na+ symporter
MTAAAGWAILGRGLEFLSRHATWWLAGGVLIGLALPPLADFARPALAPAIFLSLTLALLRLDFAEVVAYLRRPGLLIVFTAFSLLASPLVMAGLVSAIGLPAGLVAGLVLMAAGPPITAAPAFALILGLDAAFAIAAVVLAHLLVPLTLPLLALWLLDLDLNIGLGEFMGRLALFIAAAFALAAGLKRWLLDPAQLRRHATHIDGLAVVGLVVFAVAIMAGVTDFFIARPGYALLAVVAAFIANAGFQVLASGRRLAFTAGHMAGNCNMGLVLAVLADRAAIELVVFFALAQLPMYMLPVIANRIYRRFL